MVSENPLAEFRRECEDLLGQAVLKVLAGKVFEKFVLEKPPSWEFGQLASSICFDLARDIQEKPSKLAEKIVEAMDRAEFSLVRDAVAVGGYINFHADFSKLSALTVESVRFFDEAYGFVKAPSTLKIIVEHTSVNPLHPIHIGQARNPMLGDSVARMLTLRGHEVSRHYYIDDVGRQTAVIAYGYERLGRPKPREKPDHFIGKIYTITSCLVEINRLKKELERAKTVSGGDEEVMRINRMLDEWVSIAFELKSKYPELFEELLRKIGADEDPESVINALNRAYEEGRDEAKQLIREVSQLCLEGFRETLNRAGVSYDSWDWESDLVWSGLVGEVLLRLKQTPYVLTVGGVLEFFAQKVVEDLNLKDRLGLRSDYEVPSLTLVRADGTTLYTTRDIAYTLWKFERAEKCINVIGMEQSLAQLQLKIALYALGFKNYAENHVHFAYNLVTLPGYKMSSRRGRYITLDEVMEEAVERAYVEVSKRSPQLSEDEKRKVAEIVGVGAVRYALVEVDPAKPVEFKWDKVLNFERNSAPYIQYSHARACSIMNKAARKPEKPSYASLKEKLEHEIVYALASFPETFIEASELLKPNLIAEYANLLADKFNTFYNAFPVIKAETPELSDARLAMVDAVRIVLRNALSLIGITPPERM
ncbi:MAG: arginine--tRNA ligase [Candidatus Bathyarchaeia archaeon]